LVGCVQSRDCLFYYSTVIHFRHRGTACGNGSASASAIESTSFVQVTLNSEAGAQSLGSLDACEERRNGELSPLLFPLHQIRRCTKVLQSEQVKFVAEPLVANEVLVRQSAWQKIV
jgi:hypothetical protein